MELQKKVESLLEQGVKENLVAGANVLVRKDGEEVLYAQAGEADRENHTPLQRDTIFRLYSQSKPVTSAAAMLLMERGEIDLCQSVEEFLPAYHGIKVLRPDGKPENLNRPLMLQNLLNMTSGLSYPGVNNASDKGSALVFDEACARLRTDNEMSTRELADKLAQYPLAYQPGTSWQYGSSADVLGAVIEVVSGKRLGDFLADEIFKPLGMKDTGFYVPAEKQHRLAKVYGTVPGGMERYLGDNLAINNLMDREPAYQAGGAGLVSTLDDYMKFATMLLGGGELDGVRILKENTVKHMTSGQLMPGPQTAFGGWISLEGHTYANLLRVCKNPGQAIGMAGEGEYGWDGWLGMYFANFPKERMTILMGTQKKDSGTFSLTRKVRNVVLSTIE